MCAGISGLFSVGVSNNAQNYDDNITFVFYDIQSIQPSGGPHTGGTQVRILHPSTPQPCTQVRILFGGLGAEWEIVT